MGKYYGGATRRLVAAGATSALLAGAMTTVGAPAFAVDDNLRGSVTDPQGNPINGEIIVYDANGDDIANSFVTGGRISTNIPTSGSFRLEFSPDDFSLQNEFYLDQADLASANVVSAGTTLAPWTINRAPYVTGIVTDPSGAPIEGADLSAVDATTQSFRGSAETDDDGKFELPAFGTGPVKVVISANSFATEWYNDQPTFATGTAVTATSSGVDLGNIGLTKGASISGVVTNNDGAPLERVQVSGFDQTTGASGSDFTDATGAYTIEGLSAGSYRLRATDFDIDEYQAEYYANVEDPAAATPVVAGKDQAVPGINFALTPTNEPAKTGVDATGTVRDSEGKPLVGVRVLAESTPTDVEDTNQLDVDFTNRAGVYELDRLDGVPDDAVRVYAQGFEPREKTAYGVQGAYYGNTQSPLTATAVPTAGLPRTALDISLATNGGISGKISSDTGARLKGAGVAFYDEDGEGVGQFARVESDGTYKTQALRPGTYTVQFGAFEHLPEFWNDTVRGKATPVVVTSAATAAGVDAVLTQALVAVDRPTIAGFVAGEAPLVGSTLTAAKGTWNLMTDVAFGYEWLADGVVAGTGPTFPVTAAVFGKAITLRVSASISGNTRTYAGQATSETTKAVQATTTTKAKAKKGKVKVSIASAAAPVAGKVIVELVINKNKSIKVSTGKVKNGKAKLKIDKILKSKKLAKALKKLKGKKAKKAQLAFVFDGANYVESQDKISLKKLAKANKGGKKKKGKGGKKGKK